MKSLYKISNIFGFMNNFIDIKCLKPLKLLDFINDVFFIFKNNIFILFL